MPPEAAERRLAAIMFTDIVGYTAPMAESEQRGRRLRDRHVTTVRPLVESSSQIENDVHRIARGLCLNSKIC